MSAWIGSLSVPADAVILVALAAAVVSRGLSHLARLMIAAFALVCAWLFAAGLEEMRAPGWTVFMGAAVIVASIVVTTATLHLWTQGDGGGDVGSGPRGAHGGGGPRRRQPDAPHHGGGGSSPTWWPEFERQFALYVAECEREQRQPVVLPPEPTPDVTAPPG